MIQSGKTSEIIEMLYFCIRYLKIPVIILIQNKTSGYYQLEKRIQDFSDKLEDYNIPCKYVKTGLTKTKSLKVFDIDRNVPEGEEPIIYIEMMDGKKRDTPLMNLSIIPDDPSEDEYDEDDEGDDTFYSLDESGELMLGGGEIKGAEKVSQKLINSFF